MDDSVWNWEGSPWNTRSAYMAFIRGGIRRGLWNKNPVKFSVMEAGRFKVKNENPSSKKRYPMVWKYSCAICNGVFSGDDVECDHIHGNHSLKSFDELERFIKEIISVKPEDLQILCKDCHRIKSHAEKRGISLEEAKVDKKAIKICKEGKDKEFIIDAGLVPESNASKRRIQLKEILLAKG